jgi:cytochrome P450
MDSLLPDNPFDYEKFYQALERSLTGLLQRRKAGNMRKIRYAYDPEWKEAYKEVHAYIDERVAEALEKTSSSSSNEALQGKHRKYVLLQEMAKQIRDPIELRYHIIDIFLPARDGTSTLLSNALFNLARNPHIWAQLRQTALQLDPETLTFESLKSLKDFRDVIFETLRLQGPSGRSQTAAMRDTVLPRGGGKDGQSPILVKRGTHISSNIWAMHHDPDLYPDPFVFKPERWVGKRLSWEFVPFLGGPRICPANQQVLTYATYTLVRLTREFASIENRDPVLQYVELTKMATRSRNGVKISLKRRPE